MTKFHFSQLQRTKKTRVSSATSALKNTMMMITLNAFSCVDILLVKNV
jgi:hypothetical protein